MVTGIKNGVSPTSKAPVLLESTLSEDYLEVTSPEPDLDPGPCGGN